MSQISVKNLTFAYEGSYDNVFENVSFQIDTDWKLGFSGRNGRGKTTFLKLLLGEYEYQGSITAGVTFDYFPFPVADKSRLTHEVIEGINSGGEIWRIYKELSLLKIDEGVLYRPFETLSNGEQTKVLLAALFIKEGNFLLIDEPVNHLDYHARKAVSQYLQKKKGYILVSHDRIFLDNCIDHILSINKTNIEIQQGNFSSWLKNKEYQDQFELGENERLKKDIKRLTESARRTANWSDKVESTKIGSGVYDRGHVGHMAAKMMKRSKSTENRQRKAIEDKSKLLKNIESEENLKLMPLTHHGARLVDCKDFVISYDGHKVFEPLEFFLAPGDRTALLGGNGCGKSSILKLMMGEDITYSGMFKLAGGLTISYVPQDASFLAGSLKEYAVLQGISETLFYAILRKLDFSRTQFEKDMSAYSGGQKKKVLLAKSLCQQAHLYIWDEPLNFIDVFSRIQIERLILEYQPTLLFVEHDGAFVENIATRRVDVIPAHG